MIEYLEQGTYVFKDYAQALDGLLHPEHSKERVPGHNREMCEELLQELIDAEPAYLTGEAQSELADANTKIEELEQQLAEARQHLSGQPLAS